MSAAHRDTDMSSYAEGHDAVLLSPDDIEVAANGLLAAGRSPRDTGRRDVARPTPRQQSPW
jgi:hypothetical protein